MVVVKDTTILKSIRGTRITFENAMKYGFISVFRFFFLLQKFWQSFWFPDDKTIAISRVSSALLDLHWEGTPKSERLNYKGTHIKNQIWPSTPSYSVIISQLNVELVHVHNIRTKLTGIVCARYTKTAPTDVWGRMIVFF